MHEAFRNGLIILGGVMGLISGSAGDHFELLPPYTVGEEHLNSIVDIIEKSISKVVSELPNR